MTIEPKLVEEYLEAVDPWVPNEGCDWVPDMIHLAEEEVLEYLVKLWKNQRQASTSNITPLPWISQMGVYLGLSPLICLEDLGSLLIHWSLTRSVYMLAFTFTMLDIYDFLLLNNFNFSGNYNPILIPLVNSRSII